MTDTDIDIANADKLLTTTRSVRRRLDFSRPVAPALIQECLDVALQAPTGGNLQMWRFVVVTDADKRRAIADIYRKAWEVYLQAAPTTYAYRDDDPRAAAHPRVVSSSQYLADHLEQAPVFLVPCVMGRVDGLPHFRVVTTLASVLPAVWSFMLAARARGLGTCMTTLTLMHEQEVAAVLGIPDNVSQCGLIPVAHYTGDTFRAVDRLPAERVVSWDTWGRSTP
jgi:nitroreductase